MKKETNKQKKKHISYNFQIKRFGNSTAKSRTQTLNPHLAPLFKITPSCSGRTSGTTVLRSYPLGGLVQVLTRLCHVAHWCYSSCKISGSKRDLYIAHSDSGVSSLESVFISFRLITVELCCLKTVLQSRGRFRRHCGLWKTCGTCSPCSLHFSHPSVPLCLFPYSLSCFFPLSLFHWLHLFTLVFPKI